MASLFIRERGQRLAYLQQTRTAQTDIETPLFYRADGFEDERAVLIEVVKVRIQKGERIAILLPLKRQVFGFAQGLREEGLEIETQDDLDFGTDTPKIITYHSAKGLTFDSVLLPRLMPRSFPKSTSDRIERLLFVAITRATRWAYLSTDSRLPQLQRLDPLIDEKRIAVRDAGDAASARPAVSNKETDDLLDAL